MVLLLNACGTALCRIDWQRAVTLLVTVDERGVPLAVVHEADPVRVVRSPSLELPFPRVVRLSTWVHVRYVDRRDTGPAGLASKAAVLARDRRTCVYCGRPGATVDHLVPQSRGGRSTWENLAACCEPCNGRKADRTPAEAGMRLRWQPWRPDVAGRTQRRVWRDWPVPA